MQKQLLSPRVEQVHLADPSNYNYDRETNEFFRRERERRWREEEERQERARAERRANPSVEPPQDEIMETFDDFIQRITSNIRDNN